VFANHTDKKYRHITHKIKQTMLELFASSALRNTITRIHKSRIGGRQFSISPLGSTTISTHNYSSTTLQLYTKQQINTYDWYQQMNVYDHSSKQNLDPLSMNRRFYSYSSKSDGDNKEETKLSTSKGEPTKFENLSFKEKAKILATEYGVAFTVWWTFVWAATGFVTYGAIEMSDIDSLTLIAKLESYVGYDLSSKIDPKYGNIGLAVVVNEVFEPLRFPIVIATTKPVVDRIRAFRSTNS